MKINKKTKISKLIKHNPDSIEAIASINKSFHKIRNPVLRKILAPRVSIEDAAMIGGCTVNEIFEKLKLLGFEPELSKAKNMETENNNEAYIKLPFTKVSASKIYTLDVRPLIQSGRDPFHEIMNALKNVPGDGYFCLVNSFEPVPLINVLKPKGYNTYVDKVKLNEIHTWFWKQLSKEDELQELNLDNNENLIQELVQKYENKMNVLDVRELVMPKPMVTILEELEKLADDHALFVHHKKVPVFLLPELKERGFEWCCEEIDTNEVKMIIYKR